MTSKRWTEVVGIFDELRELPSNEARQRLAQACGEDDELFHEVDSLLAAHVMDFPLLDRGGALLGYTLDLGQDEPQVAIPPEGLGPYRIIGVLGRGGMGVVYLAEREDVDLRVALKLVPLSSTTDEGIRRFEHERRVLARLDHPHVARLLDAGVAPDGSPWFAMEYVHGKRIDVHCDGERLPVRERLRLLAKVSKAVAYAHQNLVVHRDLKPSNVLVTDQGEPKLLDFGIAKLLEGDPTGTGKLTEAGTRVMTPNYASPEQVLGQPVTTASDVYQLGLLGYELLTGVRPRDVEGRPVLALGGTTPLPPSRLVDKGHPGMDESAADLAYRRKTTPNTLTRTLRGDLDHVLLKALEILPENRYEAAGQFADDLNAYLAGRPVIANPGTPVQKLTKLVRRHPVAASLAGVVVLVVGLAWAALATQSARIAQERDRANQVASVLEDLVRWANPTAGMADQDRVTAGLEGAAEEALVGLETDAVAWSRILLLVAQAHKNRGEPDRAIELMERTVEALDEAVESDHPDRLVVVSWLGTTLAEFRGVEAGTPYLEEAVAGARALPVERRGDLGESLADLAFARQLDGALVEAEGLYEEALDVLLALPDSGGAGRARVYLNMGYLKNARGQPDEAEQLFRSALDVRVRAFGTGHASTANAMTALAGVLLESGHLDEADALSMGSLETNQATFEGNHVVLSSSLALRGRVLAAKGDLDASLDHLQQALEMSDSLYGRPHMTVAFAEALVGAVLARMERFDEAARVQRRALEQYRSSVGEEHFATARTMILLADTELRRGRVDEAWNLLNVALPKVEAETDPGPARVSSMLVHGAALSASGRCDEAVQVFQAALEFRGAGWPDDHPDLVRAQEGIVGCAG